MISPIENVTQLPGPLAAFTLPSPPEGEELVSAIKASLRLLDLGPDRVTVPVVGAVYRAVVKEADFSVFLVGPTGQFKSEMAGLAQQHWGAALDARHLPGNWSSTANADEAVAFVLKDALFVIDDFKPGEGVGERQRLSRDAERLLRGQGNQAGRGRMRADTSLRPAKPPRGLVLSTGEDLAGGHSLNARMAIVKIGPGEIDAGKLTECQRDGAAGLYVLAMSGFIADQHRRTPRMAADLLLGLRVFMRFAHEAGAVSADEVTAYEERSARRMGCGPGSSSQPAARPPSHRSYRRGLLFLTGRGPSAAEPMPLSQIAPAERTSRCGRCGVEMRRFPSFVKGEFTEVDVAHD